jgi:hypothetical protein
MRAIRASGSTAMTCAPTSINWADAISVPGSDVQCPDAVAIDEVDNEFAWVARTVAVVLIGGGATERLSPPAVGVRRRLWHVSSLPVVGAGHASDHNDRGARDHDRRSSPPSKRLASSRFGYPNSSESRTEPYQLFEGPAGWGWLTRDRNGAVRGETEADQIIVGGYRRRRRHRNGRAGRGVQQREHRGA